MIGLGTNRLSASRLAGLGEARQFRNGQWLEGAGSWGSPYSAAATAALKAAYPQLWETLRQFGVDNPDKVPFINQYPLVAPYLLSDGLAFMVDCQYECSAALWKDLIGGVEFNGTNVQIQNGVPYFNGNASMSSSSSVLYNSGTCTIEAVFKREKTTVCVILSGGAANDGNLQLLLARQGTYHFRNVMNYSAFVDSASTNLLTVSLNKDRGYQNEVALSRQENTSADTTVQSYSMIGNRAAGSSLPYQGYLHAIRIYNRLLTEQEILANQAIDLQRWQAS